MALTIGNFDYSYVTDEKGKTDWIFKAKDPVPPKKVIAEPVQYKLQNVIERSYKDAYQKTLKTTVKELILYINGV
jgi:hypothetical protein